ncbi:MAG: hypothetical protein IPO63_08515 [Bacteroidetes bacterium]|nr:hypothetical protein [Bacteroidota bacterium]
MMKLILLIISFCLIFSSCGVIFGGSKYQAIIHATDHPKADIYVNGEIVGKGKVKGLYKRTKTLTVELKQEGCPPKTQTFEPVFRTGNFILTIGSWALLGIVVDLVTGSSFKPDHRNDPSIKRLDYDYYRFNVDYSGCLVK